MHVDTIKPIPVVAPIRKIHIDRDERERQRGGARDNGPRKADDEDPRINEVDDYV
ncbi:MAG: hypothetical protein O3C28_20640 [Proteobacteria bacterium]|nr:hypothetical protein [Pseudomonadota bacterium]